MDKPKDIPSRIEAESLEERQIRKIATLASLEEVEGWRKGRQWFGDLVVTTPRIDAALDAQEAELLRMEIDRRRRRAVAEDYARRGSRAFKKPDEGTP